MKNLVAIAVLLVLSLFAAGCVENMPPAQWADNPPAGARIVEAPIVQVNEAWIYEKHSYGAADSYQKWEEKIIRILPDQEYIILLSDLVKKKRYLIVRDRDFSQVAYLSGRKHERKNLEQVVKELSFPLWVGKRWEVDIRATPYSGGHRNNYHSVFTVVGIENIELMGNTYEAFKIYRRDIMMSAGGFSGNADYYYVPELKRIARFDLLGAVDMRLIKYTPIGR